MPPNPCRLCSKPRYTSGLCHTHAERWRRWGKPPLEEWVAAFLESRLNICQICGKPFNGYFGSRTCSEACDKERRRRIAIANWRAKPKEEQQRISKMRPKKRKAKVTVTCEACGNTFVGFPHWKSCSADCRSTIRRVNYAKSQNTNRGAAKLTAVTIKLKGTNVRTGSGEQEQSRRTDDG